MSVPDCDPPVTQAHLQPHRAELLRDDDERDRARLLELRSDPALDILDHAPAMLAELDRLAISPSRIESAEPVRWAHYPWRRQLVSVIGPALFRRVRLDRNRYKITSPEQEALSALTIGVAGLSVGHTIAYSLAHEGLCGRLRLADFDAIELSNLNRIPTGIADIGINKAISAARRIAEIDPYLPVEVEAAGLTEETIESFFNGLDLLVEECDSLDIKIRAREEAKRRGIPVFMETSDRGLFDAELFDSDPERPILHGLLGPIDATRLRGLSTSDKAPYVMRILETDQLSARMAGSMVEIGRSVASWPQLAGDVALGAATVNAALRRHSRGELRSGRIRIDLDQRLGGLSDPQIPDDRDRGDSDVTSEADAPRDPIESIVHAMQRAPSGGNSQPWSIERHGPSIRIRIDRTRPSAMDVADRGNYLAIGAALFNARVAAAHYSMHARITAFPDRADPDLVATLVVEPGAEPAMAELFPAMQSRSTNRGFGNQEPLSPDTVRELERENLEGNGRLLLVTDRDTIGQLAELLAASDRVRYLTRHQHESMLSELRWPGAGRMDTGIDVRTLDLDAADMAKLRLSGRSDVMQVLADWDLGHALGDGTRDRILSSSAMATVTVFGRSPADYLRAGSDVERIWIRAEALGLSVHPVSPVFLYARSPEDIAMLSKEFVTDLTRMQQDFNEIIGVAPAEGTALVLRLSRGTGLAQRSARLNDSEGNQPPRQRL